MGKFNHHIEIPTDHYEIFQDIIKTFIAESATAGITNAKTYIESVSSNYPREFIDSLLKYIELNKNKISFDKQTVIENYNSCSRSSVTLIERLNINNNEKYIVDNLTTDNFLFQIGNFVFLIPEDRKTIRFRLMQYYQFLGEHLEDDIINLKLIIETKLKDHFFGEINNCLKELLKIIDVSNSTAIQNIISTDKALTLSKRNDFDALLKKHEKEITSIDEKYILCFVRLNNYINSKKHSINKIIELIKSITSLEDYKKILRI